MTVRWIPLSRPRRFLTDLLHFARRVPTVPVQRRIALGPLVAARTEVANRPCWPSIILKAFALVAADCPPLRRAYLGFPWPHLCEHSKSVASIAVERDYQGESCVFFGRISNPGELPLQEIHARIRLFADAPVESIRRYRKMLAVAALPGPLRCAGLWLGLNLARCRKHFGTFGLTVYSSLGAESLHPLSPLTTTISYGVIDSDGMVTVRFIYDHRVFDGTTAARALGKLEEVLNGPILAELRSLAAAPRMAA